MMRYVLAAIALFGLCDTAVGGETKIFNFTILGRAAPTVSTSPSPVATGDPVTVTVTNGPGNPLDWVTFDGGYTGYVYLQGNTIVTLPAPSTAGQYVARLYENNGGNILATSAPFTTFVAAVVPVITVVPAAPVIGDTSPKGSVVATVSVRMSNGTPYTGTVAFGPPNFDAGGMFALSTDKIVTNQVLPIVVGETTYHVSIVTNP